MKIQIAALASTISKTLTNVEDKIGSLHQSIIEIKQSIESNVPTDFYFQPLLNEDEVVEFESKIIDEASFKQNLV